LAEPRVEMWLHLAATRCENQVPLQLSILLILWAAPLKLSNLWIFLKWSGPLMWRLWSSKVQRNTTLRINCSRHSLARVSAGHARGRMQGSISGRDCLPAGQGCICPNGWKRKDVAHSNSTPSTHCIALARGCCIRTDWKVISDFKLILD